MRIENRELYVSFWDHEGECGVYAILVGWTDDLRPLVVYAFGVQKVEGGFELEFSRDDARRNATYMSGPK